MSGGERARRGGEKGYMGAEDNQTDGHPASQIDRQRDKQAKK